MASLLPLTLAFPEMVLYILRFYDPRAVVADVDAEEINTMKLYYEFRMRNLMKMRGQETGPLKVPDLMDSDQVGLLLLIC